MTDLRTAAQQALEALEALQGGCTDSNDGTVEAITVWCPEVITALKAALEQPEPRNQCGETCERAKLCALCAKVLEQTEQTCNCRWVGEVQTQQCTLHESHVNAIHEWAERAKAAEAKLKQSEQCRYPDCVDNGPEGKCIRWLTGECGGPKGEQE